MADEYFATLAYDHRVMAGFYDTYAATRESYERECPECDEWDGLSLPSFVAEGEFTDDEIVI